MLKIPIPRPILREYDLADLNRTTECRKLSSSEQKEPNKQLIKPRNKLKP